MASDLIYREDAKVFVRHACYKKINPIDYLDEVPAADVRPVVRGHYVGEYDGYADGNPVYDMWYCSECGCCFEDWDEKPTYNFCPNCGADMREPNLDTTKGEGRDKSSG